MSNSLKIDLFLTNTQRFTSQNMNWWTEIMWIISGLLWRFFKLFGLQWIHWWGSNVMLNFSKPDEETNSSTSRLAWGWASFHFWVNYSFKVKHQLNLGMHINANCLIYYHKNIILIMFKTKHLISPPSRSRLIPTNPCIH